MDQSRAKTIFDDIKDLRIELLRDPASLGPDYLRENIALCRNYLNKVSYYLQEVMEDAHLQALLLDEKETKFQVQSDELLSNDNRVKHLPSVEDRKAMINVLLAEDAREIKRFKREITNLAHVDKVVRHRKRELDNTMSTLRLQTSLLRDQLRSGLSYGDDSDRDREDRLRRATEGDDIDLDAILDESAAELEGEKALVDNVEEVIVLEEDEAEISGEPLQDSIVEDEVETKTTPEEEPADYELEDAFDESLEELATAAKSNKTSKKSKGKPSVAPVVEKSEDDDFGDLEDLIAEGGLDEVPKQKPIEEAKARGATPPKKDPNPLKEEDIDADMQSFLDTETGDGLDDILASI